MYFCVVICSVITCVWVNTPNFRITYGGVQCTCVIDASNWIFISTVFPCKKYGSSKNYSPYDRSLQRSARSVNSELRNQVSTIILVAYRIWSMYMCACNVYIYMEHWPFLLFVPFTSFSVFCAEYVFWHEYIDSQVVMSGSGWVFFEKCVFFLVAKQWYNFFRTQLLFIFLTVYCFLFQVSHPIGLLYNASSSVEGFSKWKFEYFWN